jgi:hypothetical protein
MAFNFFGVCTSGQWESFKAFARIQRLELQLRVNWLQKQLSMNGVFSTVYDGPNPVSFSASAGSYAAKLLSAYRVLGGVPERDMLLRTSDQPVFKTKGTNIQNPTSGVTTGGFSDVYSNGRRDRGTQRFDRDLGLRVERLKDWQLEAVKAKRERLEYKIKRALDYSDQLQSEIAVLTAVLDEASTSSFDSQVVGVEVQMATPGAANVIDNLDDVFGLAIGKPGDLSFADALQQGKQNDERVPT